MVLIRKDLNYALHQIILSQLIFTVDDLFKGFQIYQIIQQPKSIHAKRKLVVDAKMIF